VKLYEQNFTQQKIADILEVHRCTVVGWLKRAGRGGIVSLKSQTRGPKRGVHAQLSQEQQRSIRRLIVDKTPDQLKLAFALWTREAVGDLIAEQTGKRLDLRQVGRYLRAWGFTPQRPAKRAYKRCEKKVAEWLEKEYPEIEQKARNEGAEIHWADETGLCSHDHRGRGYSPKGKTPVRLHNPSKEKVNMISSLTNRGKLRFMCYEGSFDYVMFHRFLKALLKEAAGRKLHVIVDNLRVHHAKVIKRWLRRYSRFIEVHYLPSYSPDLNPDEYFNGDIKAHLAKRPERRTKGQWASTVQATVEHLASQPSRIQSYFQAPSIRYASGVA
jgi:transposase